MTDRGKSFLKLFVDLALAAGFLALLFWTRRAPNAPATQIALGASVAGLVAWRLVRRRL